MVLTLFSKWISSFVLAWLIGLGSVTGHGFNQPNLQPPVQLGCELAFLAAPDDPYYPLAEEIAAAENAPVFHSLADVIACRPVFLLWIVSPGFLSDSVMVDFGLALKGQPVAISTGIISGSTIEQARVLWQQRAQVRGQNLFVVNASNPAAHIEARILALGNGQTTRRELSKSGFESVLKMADYLTFTGHGSSGYLRLDDETKFSASDVPILNSVVVGTGSCQTFRLWDENSIARRFADQGAAAYSGFVYSPNEGYLIGEFDGLPFRYTWPDFPIGHVLQAQNRGTLQGFAFFPYQYLLGDPRIALRDAPPYRLMDDRLEGEQRLLTYQGVPEGIIPIRIPGGRDYQFVEALGITSAAEQDPFYNSKLQMVNIQADKFILLVHPGGDLTLRLRPRAPWYWFPLDILLDSLDHTFLFSQQTGGDMLSLVFAVIPLAWLGWQAFRKRLIRQKVCLGVGVGLGAAFLHGVFALFRLEWMTITSKPVVFSPAGLFATFILIACGAVLFFHSRSWAGKLAGLLAATFASWSPMLFGGLAVFAFNQFAFVPATGVPLYNQSLAWLPGISFLFTFPLLAMGFGWLNHLPRLEGA